MKRILTFITVSIIAGSAFIGCRKYDYNPSAAAKIDGVAFTGNTRQRIHAQVDTGTHNPQVVIVTCTSDVFTPGTAFTPYIVLVAPHVIGTYTIDTFNKLVPKTMVYTAATGNDGSPAVSGEIKILSVKDRKIIGNFSFTCANGTVVTEGQYVAEENYY